MKRILFLLLIFVYAFSWGQTIETAKYKVELFDLKYQIRKGVKKKTSSNVTLTLNYTDGTKDEIYYAHINHRSDDQDGWNLTLPLIDKKPLYIRVSGFVNFRTGTDADYDENVYLNDCQLQNFEIDTHTSRMSDITFKVKVSPVHKLISEINPIENIVNTFLPSDDEVKLYARQGFDANLYHYQYRLDSTSWIDIDSSLYNSYILSLSGEDLFGGGYAQYLGENIYFRVVSCYEGGVYRSWSDPVVLKISQSSPRILNSSSSDTKCSDTEDGTAMITFARLLETGETLQLLLQKQDDYGSWYPVSLPNDGYITTELQTTTTHIIENLPAGNYKLDLLGTYQGQSTYTDGPAHTFSFIIQNPDPVIFNLSSKTDVFCHGGSDGIINLEASGGQNTFQYKIMKDNQSFLDWTDFSNGNNTSIQNLSAGIYKIRVRDSNLCVAKENTTEKEITIEITQPSSPIDFPTQEIDITQPTGYGLSNGYISVRVIGGTSYTDGTYDFEWRKDSPTGNVISTGITTDVVNNPFTIKLDGLTAGNYYLTVRDKNYTNASSELGNCGIISQEFMVEQPDPLVANIEIQQQISCNISNEYSHKIDLNNNGIPDETEDGKLKVIATGGVGGYIYQWQKLENGIFQNITGETQDILDEQSIGTYRVLVTDTNQNVTNATYTVIYPEPLVINLSANELACNNQNDGIVSVIATGGTGNLSYQWNTGDITPEVNNLTAGNYYVLVNDSKGCKVDGNINIEQPDQIVITDLKIQNPICYGANNGSVETEISGGTPPYTIAWSNGEIGLENNNLSADDYTLTITDANGCVLSKNYHLEDPEPIAIDLGEDVTLCIGHTIDYDVSINDSLATYEWVNQGGETISSEPKLTLSEAGIYTVTVTDSKGCVATDSVEIKQSNNVLDPQFMLTTLAYTETDVILVNTSPVSPETVEWIIPNDTNIQVIDKTDQFLQLHFLETGSYEFGLKGTEGDCVDTFYKTVVVEENTQGVVINPTTVSNINQFNIIPNPNDGVFKVIVGLNNKQSIRLKIINMLSQELLPVVNQPKATYFVVPFNTGLTSGSYFIILETGGEVMVKKVLIQ